MLALLVLMAFGRMSPTLGSSQEELEQKLKTLEDEMRTLRQQMELMKAQPAPAASAPPAAAPPAAAMTPQAPAPATSNRDLFGILPSPLEGLKIGMYGE